MIVGFSKYGTGKGESAVNYMLDQDREDRINHPPEIIRGNSKLTIDLINSLDFKHKYTSGVLSFAPNETISKAMENDIINRFEEVAFSGLTPDQYNILWVRHTHAGHHEMHFVTPRVELSTSNSINIKPPGKNTQNHYDQYRNEINSRYGLADPEDPSRKRTVSKPNHEIKIALKALRSQNKPKTDIRAIMDGFLTEKAINGEIKSREDVLDHIKQLDLSITREGSDYITIFDSESNKRFRMKGELYERDFTPSRTIEKATTRRYRDYSKPSQQDAEQFARKVDELNQRKAQYNRARYNLPIPENTQTIRMGSIDHDNDLINSFDAGIIHMVQPTTGRYLRSKKNIIGTQSCRRSNDHCDLQRQTMPSNNRPQQNEITHEHRREETLHNTDGEVSDGTRENIIKRIAGITDSIQRDAKAITREYEKIGRRVHRDNTRNETFRNAERNTQKASESLNESNREFDKVAKIVKQIRRTKQNKENSITLSM